MSEAVARNAVHRSLSTALANTETVVPIATIGATKRNKASRTPKPAGRTAMVALSEPTAVSAMTPEAEAAEPRPRMMNQSWVAAVARRAISTTAIRTRADTHWD